MYVYVYVFIHVYMCVFICYIIIINRKKKRDQLDSGEVPRKVLKKSSCERPQGEKREVEEM